MNYSDLWVLNVLFEISLGFLFPIKFFTDFSLNESKTKFEI